ncbi:alpha/beta-hydrolase [Wolfiporia cocos MD-104 SS10]|uniref:Alpha/beta-hydrolase n=1 Tax=Wolfiporia cocos (strain MD-104) TaxID=742152 RepID=A0A2H3JWT2_WOLCO|nr:alpha/beta-hydrolase [Wolfiporia cocos MD-104 SS10]
MGYRENKVQKGSPALLLTDYSTPQRGAFHRSRALLKHACLIIVLYGIHALWSTGFQACGLIRAISTVRSEEPEFDWFSLDPSTEITWSSCFSEYKCARLILPLDYLSPPGYGPNVTLALQMLPATDTENYRGTILINPGGPGGSGTDLVRRRGKDISRIAGGSFDVLGFDPRGTGASTPSAQCFDSQSQHKIWDLQGGDRMLNLTDGSIPFARARQAAIGRRCEEVLGGNGKESENGTAAEWGAGRFMSTASVATDMLEITQRLGEDKLKYWGFSYGSILGQYFSAMYPDKVGRVVIDGVFDGYNYLGALWNSNLVDTDAVWQSFFMFCHQAGSSKCPLYESSVDKIQNRVNSILSSLIDQPLVVPFTSTGPFVLTEKALHTYAFRASYSPVINFPSLAELFVSVERNNQTALSELSSKFDTYACSCTDTPQWLTDHEALHVISCGDGDPYQFSADGFHDWFTNLTAISQFAAPIWGNAYLRCAEWRVRPKWRYTGPLAAENTSNPVLLVSPAYDTVCPLTDARAVHARYGGSGLLVQNSYGHCSLAAPSLCTAKHLRAYFENGTLPKEGTVCEPDELPFVGTVNHDVHAMSTEDKELLDALRGMAEEVPSFGLV